MGLCSLVTLFGILFFLVKTVLPLAYQEKLESPLHLGPSKANGVAFARESGLPIALRFNGNAKCEVELLSIPNLEVIQKLQVALVDNSVSFVETAPNPSTGVLSCYGLHNDSLLVISERGASARKVEEMRLSFERHFINDDELAMLSPELYRKISEDGFIRGQDGQMYTRASENAPIAVLSPSLQSQAQIELPDLPAALRKDQIGAHTIRFVHQGTSGGLFYAVGKSNSVVAFAFLYVNTTNAITSEVSTRILPIRIVSDGARTRQVVDLSLLPDGTLVTFYSDGEFVLEPIPSDEATEFVIPSANPPRFKVENIASLESGVRIYGGELFLVDDGKGTCAAIDIGQISRQIKNQESAETRTQQSNWSRACRESGEQEKSSLEASPAARIAIRYVSDSISAFEMTTGRIAFETNSRTLLKAQNVLPDVGTVVVEGMGFSHNGQDVLLSAAGHTFNFELFAPHLEASKESFFSRVAYEGYQNPTFSWQSTSGSEQFQPKLSLIPLMWGTLKATFYAMIFAIPLGVFAAIYSSEFLDRSTRNILKPTVEMMASVPSVVLGFLAAIVIAPWVESRVVSVLIAGLTTPFCMYFLGTLSSSYSAKHLSTRGLYASRRLLIWLVAGCIVSFFLLLQVGRFVEQTAFGGDIKNFLIGGPGSEGALWAILLLPVVLMTLWSLAGRRLGKKYRLIVFCFAPLISFLIGLLIAKQGGFRTEFFGAYAQRNTLVIAIAMGFAIIPIIYSLSEDALSAVPSSLRAGSLACGASVWQTTARVVLPTAASGIFSAIMIGIGRAVGETMIVVMATGNTAVMGFNPFEGLRSLAANIAVELPEAPQGGTHYRTLFLSALILFAFTFILNSLAEFMRHRYRERNKAL